MPQEEEGVSAGAIAGIIIGVFVALVGFVACFVYLKRARVAREFIMKDEAAVAEQVPTRRSSIEMSAAAAAAAAAPSRTTASTANAPDTDYHHAAHNTAAQVVDDSIPDTVTERHVKAISDLLRVQCPDPTCGAALGFYRDLFDSAGQTDLPLIKTCVCCASRFCIVCGAAAPCHNYHGATRFSQAHGGDVIEVTPQIIEDWRRAVQRRIVEYLDLQSFDLEPGTAATVNVLCQAAPALTDAGVYPLPAPWRI